MAVLTSKQMRNSGEAYVSLSTKKAVPARKVGEGCRDGCFDKNLLQDLKKNFHN